MKKVIILSTILVSTFILASCAPKKTTQTPNKEEVKTVATLESIPEEEIVQIPIPEEIIKISQDNTGSKEFIPTDQLEVVKVTSDSGEENTVHLLTSSTDESIDAILAEDGALVKYIYQGNNLFLIQFLLAIDEPTVLNEIQSYMAEETFSKQYSSEKFNYEINHNSRSERPNPQTTVKVTKI